MSKAQPYIKTSHAAIKKYLIEKGMFERVDEVHIKALLTGAQICNEALEEMARDNGAIKDKSKNPEKEVRQMTQAPGLYALGYNLILKASRQLGLSPRARIEMGILKVDDDDDPLNQL